MICLGTAVVDTIYAVERLPLAPGKSYAQSVLRFGGGVAGNAAVTVSALGGEGVPYMAGNCALTDQLARPWQEHPAYGDGPRLAAAGAAWCRRYPDFEHAAAG